jgi:SAM-dependent methyltransferase
MGYSLKSNGIFTPDVSITHREDQYDSAGFDILQDMQRRHFWYQGRHRFVLRALLEELDPVRSRQDTFRAVDLGGGCGGWINYLQTQMPSVFSELALADSSLRALQLAGSLVGQGVSRYQVDLLSLQWQERWDVAFLLDVLEHIPEDSAALLQIRRALTPGGLLLVTTPALQCFWSYNDDLAHHVRRYAKRDLMRLASVTGLRLVRASYFMFFLSPLLWLSRLTEPDLGSMNEEQRHHFAQRTHRVPAEPVNRLLRFVFDLETPLGLRIPFPWGTSILGVFQRPA